MTTATDDAPKNKQNFSPEHAMFLSKNEAFHSTLAEATATPVSVREANKEAKQLRKDIDTGAVSPTGTFFRYCSPCRAKVSLPEWSVHLRSEVHLNSLEKQVKDPAWIEQNWPGGADATKWCPKCERNLLQGDWYAHVEAHRIRVRKKRR